MSLQQTHQTEFPTEAVHRFTETATRPLFWNISHGAISSRHPKTRMKAEIRTMGSRKLPGAAI
jgi:hypothetical protein